MPTSYPTALDTTNDDAFRATKSVRSGKVSAQSNSGTTGAAALQVDFDPSASGEDYPGAGLLVCAPDDNSAKPVILRYTAVSASGGSPGSFTISARGLHGTADRNILVGERVGLSLTNEHHDAHSGALIALETKLGTGSDVAASGEFLKGTGAGVSAWSALTSSEVTTALGYTPLRGSGSAYYLPRYSTTTNQLETSNASDDVANGIFAITGNQRLALFGQGKGPFGSTGGDPNGDILSVDLVQTKSASSAQYYQGSAINSRLIYGQSGAGNVAIGTMHGITTTVDVVNAGDKESEVAIHGAYLSCVDTGSTPPRLWGMDLVVSGPPNSAGSHSNTMIGAGIVLNRHKSTSANLRDVAILGATYSYWAMHGRSEATYPLYALLALNGYSGATDATVSNATVAADFGLVIGDWAGPWQASASSSRFSKLTYGAKISDYTDYGLYLIGNQSVNGFLCDVQAIAANFREINASGTPSAGWRWVMDAGAYRVDRCTDSGTYLGGGSAYETLEYIDTSNHMTLGGDGFGYPASLKVLWNAAGVEIKGYADFKANAYVKMAGIAGNPSSLANGDYWYNTTQKSHRFRSTAGTQGLVGLLYTNTAVSAAVVSTTTETNFDKTFSIPANAPTVGKKLWVRAYGLHSTSGAPTLTLRFKLGSTVIVTSGAITTGSGASNRLWSVDLMLTFISVGATGTVEAQGFAMLATSATAVTIADMENTAVITVDTTAALTAQVSAQWSIASSSNTTTLRDISIVAMD